MALGWVALGGAIGAPLRFAVSGLVGRRFGETFPWGTMAVNVSGAFTIGLLAAAFDGAAQTSWLFATTGVLGSYTTVSSFSLQTLNLARDGQYPSAAANAALSVSLCLGAAGLGFLLGLFLIQ
ncbi:MAG: fluoride efflux transporter CrcB [Caulobacteraceae bacterium]